MNRGDDMCLGINHCNSMIVSASSSSFGFWIAYLMPDNAPVFYNSQMTDNANHTKDVHDYDAVLEEWIRLTVHNGTAQEEKRWWYQRHNWTKEQAEHFCCFKGS